METPSFIFPEIKTFQIPFNPKKLRFANDVIDKTRFQKLSIDRKLIKAFNNHLIEKIDKNVLFYLKMVGRGDSLIKYQNNKVSYYNSRRLLNAGVAPFEYPTDSSTSALYHLNESNFPTDNAKDETGVNVGNVTGCLSTEAKVLSPGAYFDGLDDNIAIANHASLNFGDTNFTVEAWYKTTRTTRQAVVDKFDSAGGGFTNGGYVLEMGVVEGEIRWQVDDAGYFTTAAVTYSDDKWHHQAGVRDGDLVRLYFSGNQVNTAACGVVSDTDRGMHIGVFEQLGNYFLGSIDEVRISNIARKIFGGIAPQIIM